MFFWNSLALYDPMNVGNFISHSSAFSKPSLDIWKFLVPIMLKPSMQDFKPDLTSMGGFPAGSENKASACKAGDPGLIPGLGRSLEMEMATHSSILAWRIPWTEEPAGLQSTGSQRVGHNRATSLHSFCQGHETHRYRNCPDYAKYLLLVNFLHISWIQCPDRSSRHSYEPLFQMAILLP